MVLAADERRKDLLLKQYFDDILFKDVALRHEVRDVRLLRALAVYLLSKTASLARCSRVPNPLCQIDGVTLTQHVPFFDARVVVEHVDERLADEVTIECASLHL